MSQVILFGRGYNFMLCLRLQLQECKVYEDNLGCSACNKDPRVLAILQLQLKSKSDVTFFS